MNGISQRKHRTVTQSLEKRLDDVETVILQLGKNNDWLKLERDKQVGVCDDRWADNANARKRLGERFDSFMTMTRWQRLRWVLGL